jgi:hypothetical protein
MPDQLTKSEIDQIDHRDIFVRHVTRHLAQLSENSKRFLTDLGVDRSEMQAMTETHGSKFNRSIQDPRTIIDFAKSKLSKIIERTKVDWVLAFNGTREVAQLILAADINDKKSLGLNEKEKLGTSTVVEITDENKHLVRKEVRGRSEDKDGIMINVIRGLPIPTTDQLVINLLRSPDSKQLTNFSAYTGTIAEPLPDPDSLSANELEKSMRFWNTHAFLG